MSKLTENQQALLNALRKTHQGWDTNSGLAADMGVDKLILLRSARALERKGLVEIASHASGANHLITIALTEGRKPAPAPKGFKSRLDTEMKPGDKPIAKWQAARDAMYYSATLSQIATRAGVTEKAAKSLIADVRRKGYKVTYSEGWYTSD